MEPQELQELREFCRKLDAAGGDVLTALTVPERDHLAGLVLKWLVEQEEDIATIRRFHDRLAKGDGLLVEGLTIGERLELCSLLRKWLQGWEIIPCERTTDPGSNGTWRSNDTGSGKPPASERT